MSERAVFTKEWEMKKKYYGEKKGMMSSVKNDFANMPQDVKHVSYPKSSYGGLEGYRDTREGIDSYAKENHGKVKKQLRKPSDA